MAAFHVRREQGVIWSICRHAAVKSSHKVQQYNFRIVTVCFCLSTVLRSRILANQTVRQGRSNGAQSAGSGSWRSSKPGEAETAGQAALADIGSRVAPRISEK